MGTHRHRRHGSNGNFIQGFVWGTIWKELDGWALRFLGFGVRENIDGIDIIIIIKLIIITITGCRKIESNGL